MTDVVLKMMNYVFKMMDVCIENDESALRMLDVCIENDELGGLPTCVILREILTFPTALAAATWLRSIPRAVPNAYMSV